jgi:hypothetical protein
MPPCRSANGTVGDNFAQITNLQTWLHTLGCAAKGEEDFSSV